MADSDPPRLVDLIPGDETEAMALSIEAGWNQIEEDWRHFIVNGKTIGFRNHENQLVATAATLPYEGDFGFIGMVIVSHSSRRQGLATKLVVRCIQILREMKLIPALDATEQGETVYRRQGFIPQFRYDRWEVDRLAGEPSRTSSQTVEPAFLAGLDAAAFGARRERLFEDFLARPDTVAQVENEDAFALIRRGRRASAVGPLVATSEQQALRLLDQILVVEQPIFIDVPQRWEKIGKWLEERGFSIQRSFARMALDRSEPFGQPERLFAVAGPEFG